MNNMVLLAIFVAMGMVAVIYDAMINRPLRIKRREYFNSLIAKSVQEQEARRLEDGYIPTPKEQVYDYKLKNAEKAVMTKTKKE